MKEIERFVLPNGKVGALEWCGNSLRDFPGIRTYELDGTRRPLKYSWGDRFNRSISSKDGRYSVLFEQLGTKGLILKDQELLREMNRSYYCSDAYVYPVTVFDLPDGRTVIAHCPDDYCRLEIEEIESGKRLTSRQGKAEDFFHSRLQASPDGRYLLSAGWIWHPLDRLLVYDVGQVLENPEILDTCMQIELGDKLFEIGSAAFLGTDRILISGYEEEESKPVLGIRDLPTGETRVVASLGEPAGVMMPVGDFVVSFFGCPKLIEIDSGRVVHRWEELDSGRQNSSIISAIPPLPHVALDPRHLRFAVAGADSITVIQLGA